MGKKTIKFNKRAYEQIFNDLTDYRIFCKNYGYKFSEENLYNMRVYSYQQYQKKLNGKNFKDQLSVDLARLNR